MHDVQWLSRHNLPNLLTVSRIVVIPFILAAFYGGGAIGAWIATILFVYAGLTDFLDGWLARRLKVQSAFGIFLDPIADKLLVAAVLLALVDADQASVIPALIIMLREIMVAGLREYLATQSISVPVTTLAKWKTTIQLVALGVLLFAPAASPDWYLHSIGNVLLWGAAAMTGWTGYQYVRGGVVQLDAVTTDPSDTAGR